MKRTLGLMLILCFSTSAFALTLKEKKQFMKWQDQLAKEDEYGGAETFKKKCGVEIPASLDEHMVTPFMEKNASLSSYCGSARKAMAGMCSDATSKESILKQVKKIDCKGGKEGELNIKLSGSTLVLTFGTGAANMDEKVKEFLENNLK